MKKPIFLAAAISVLGGTAAFATSFDVKFQFADNSVTNVTFNDANKSFTNDKGQSGAYTYDETSMKLCGTYTDGVTSCVTMGGKLDKAGDVVAFTDPGGQAGHATLIAKK